MSKSFVRPFRSTVVTSVALIAMVPHLAFAQQAADEEAGADEDIVVTGTLVRGIAPPGANVIGVTAKAIEETGATNVNQVLQTIPQLASFGNLQQPLANSPEVAVNRPNLRSLPGFNTSGGSSTLVLLDGHRIVGVGTASTSPDPDVIPPGVLERVEIVPDGGSAIYGSDAVAGVMNFITLKRFDGVKVDASYGFADDYYQWSANATVGKDWGSGSLFASYSYAKTDLLVGADRDYVREFPNAAGYTNLSCGAGNVEALPAGPVVGLPNVTLARAPNQCDGSDFATVYPSSERHSVFAGLTQQLDDTLSFELRGYYTNRHTYIQNGPFRQSSLISPFPGFVDTSAISSPYSNPFSPSNIPGNFLAFAQNVYYTFGANNASRADIRLSTWGLTPTFTKDLGDNWRLRLLGSFGESTSSFISTAVNGQGLNSAITSGLLNPYDLNGPGTPFAGQVLSAITNWQSYAKAKQTLYNARAIVDGDLFTMGGGAVKLAFGLEYSKEVFRADTGNSVPGSEYSGSPVQLINGVPIIFSGPATNGVPNPGFTGIAPVNRVNLSRNVKSVFGELIVPIFSGENATDGFRELTLSLAGRYDSYSDFGDTFNPRIGVTWKPIDGVSIHGAWGKSFNAPSLADDEAATQGTLFILSGNAASFFKTGAPNPAAPGNIVALRGNRPGIAPQKATTWTLGVDLQPSFVPGLNIGVSYYNIDFRGFIGLPPFESPGTLWRDYSSVITVINNTNTPANQAILNAAFAAAGTTSDGSTTAPLAGSTYAFFDARKQNVGDVKTDGLDFSVAYRTDTGFGSVFLNANGTYSFSFKLRPTGLAAYTETITTNNSRFRSRVTVGADIGSLTAQATWNHLQGYQLSPIVGFIPQSRVDSFNTVDLFFRYALKGEGWNKDLALTLNVNNVFDQDPPVYRGGTQVAGRNGYANGATLGRLVQFGVSKKF